MLPRIEGRNGTRGLAMSTLGTLAAVALIVVVLFDSFEVMLLPRRITHRFRPARQFFRHTWTVWKYIATWLPLGRWRHGWLSMFGPCSLLGLLVFWAAGLIVGFGLLHWSLGTTLISSGTTRHSLATCLYFSGTTFVTLGYGDVVPITPFGRMLSVAESGMGFGFLAIMISYLPVLYQAFSRREIVISLLDARAGSPPSAGELLRRIELPDHAVAMEQLLIEWERWSAELLESQVSFPALSYYRSQHDNQSWVATLTVILDTSAALIASADRPLNRQARLTFAMARHAVVDLGMVYQTPPQTMRIDRLPDHDFAAMVEWLTAADTSPANRDAMQHALAELRLLYEPFVIALAGYFQLAVPPFLPSATPIDNWQTSPWTRRAPNLANLTPAAAEFVLQDVH